MLLAVAVAALAAAGRTVGAAPPPGPTSGPSTRDTAAAVDAFLPKNLAGRRWGMVVAMGDERGTRVFAAGGMGDAANRPVDGKTVFEIGSVTKTFTVLLLEDMVERGVMKLDDPLANYLPESVHVPS